MHELEFLLTHPSNDISVQTLCNMTIEPMLLRMFDSLNSEQSSTKGIDASHSKVKNGSVFYGSFLDHSPEVRGRVTSSPTSSLVPPLVLRSAITGLTRALGSSRALVELASPLCNAVLRSLIVLQQERHAKVLIAAGISPQDQKIPEQISPLSVNDLSEYSFRENLVLHSTNSSLQIVLTDGVAIKSSSLGAGDRELSLLYRIYTLMKLCCTWVKKDRSSFCLSEMAVLSRSRYLIMR